MNEGDPNLFIVEFETYCSKCKYGKQPETKDPCNECLAIGVCEGSRKPQYFEEDK